MLTNRFAGLAVLLGLLYAGGGWATEKLAAVDCCKAGLACCAKDKACCAATTKLGCCAKGMKCCAKDAACCAAVPVVRLLGLLATGKVSALRSAAAGLASAVLMAVFVFVPKEAGATEGPGLLGWAGTVLAAAADGAAFGLLPIGWIVVAAIFL